MEKTIEIPEGYEARIEGNKVILEQNDEKIRSFLYEFIKVCGWSEKQYPPKKRVLAYLERQKRQKPIFRVGDYVRNIKTGDKVLIEQLDIATKIYCYVSNDGTAEIHSDFPFSKQDEWEVIGQQVEKKPAINIEHLKSYLLQYLQDASNRKDDSEIQADTDKWAKMIIKVFGGVEQKPVEPNWVHHKVDLSDCLEEYMKAYYDGWNNCNQQHAQCDAEQKPAEWSDSVAKEMFIKALERAVEQTKKGYELTDCDKHSWWEDFKAYSGSKPAEWSEEDSDIICEIIDHCITIPYIGGTLRLNDERKKELKTFVKSVRPQPHWKPSEDQIQVIYNVLKSKWGCVTDRACLLGLVNDLKKL